MTNMKRLSVGIPAELEERIIQLRKTDRFCRCSTSEIIRILIKSGLSNDPPPSNGEKTA